MVANDIEPNIAKGVNEAKWPSEAYTTDWFGHKYYEDPDHADAEYEWLHWTPAGKIYWNNGGTYLNVNDNINTVYYSFMHNIGWIKAKPAVATEEKTEATLTILSSDNSK